ncbi:MAG: helix-turn-helix domain-containing protein [Sphingomonas ursincola]|nr:helix-turn-helix domain-containing protein [Sphingomonas ursincola]
MQAMDPLLISVQEAARMLAVGRTSIYELINSGELETKKLGRRRLVTIDSIRRVAGKQS